MTRQLVLTTEGARHPMRRSLPPLPPTAPTRGDDHDLKLFVLSFTAFFIVFWTLLF